MKDDKRKRQGLYDNESIKEIELMSIDQSQINSMKYAQWY